MTRIVQSDLREGGMADSVRLAQEMSLAEFQVCCYRNAARAQIKASFLQEGVLMDWDRLCRYLGVQETTRTFSATERLFCVDGRALNRLMEVVKASERYEELSESGKN